MSAVVTLLFAWYIASGSCSNYVLDDEMIEHVGSVNPVFYVSSYGTSENVRMPCAIGANLPLSSTMFEWKYLTSDPSPRSIAPEKMYVNGNNGELVIKGVSNEQAGRYYCIVTFDDDEKKIVFLHHIIALELPTAKREVRYENRKDRECYSEWKAESYAEDYYDELCKNFNTGEFRHMCAYQATMSSVHTDEKDDNSPCNNSVTLSFLVYADRIRGRLPVQDGNPRWFERWITSVFQTEMDNELREKLKVSRYIEYLPDDREDSFTFRWKFDCTFNKMISYNNGLCVPCDIGSQSVKTYDGEIICSQCARGSINNHLDGNYGCTACSKKTLSNADHSFCVPRKRGYTSAEKVYLYAKPLMHASISWPLETTPAEVTLENVTGQGMVFKTEVTKSTTSGDSNWIFKVVPTEEEGMLLWQKIMIGSLGAAAGLLILTFIIHRLHDLGKGRYGEAHYPYPEQMPRPTMPPGTAVGPSMGTYYQPNQQYQYPYYRVT